MQGSAIIQFSPFEERFLLRLNGLEIQYSEDYGVVDDESELEIQKFKIAGPIWWTKKNKVTYWDDV